MSQNLQHSDIHTESTIEATTLYSLTDDGVFPNNVRLPLTVYHQAVVLPRTDLAARFEALFAAHHWPSAWRYGIFAYHHYHSTAHEALGVFRGRATLQFGGEKGVIVEVQTSDVVVIPAGVAHRNINSSWDFCVVGAYPEGQNPDMCMGKLGERPRADGNIADALLPQADPLYGPNGPLMTYWSAADG